MTHDVSVAAHATIREIDGSFSLSFPCGELPADEAVVAADHEPNGYFWEGVAQYFDVLTPQSRSKAAAWSYPRPLASAIERVGADFSDYVAFDPAFVEVG